jgi:putative ABC transport system substrate-binding protein
MGFVEGSNIVLEYRWAENRYERMPALAADLVRRRPAVIACVSPAAALALKAETTSIPIVFIVGEDPVKTGLVTSFSRPGGNLTGVTPLNNQLTAKRLEVLRQVAPKATVFGLLVNPANPNAGPDADDAQAAAVSLGVQLRVLQASVEGDLAKAFAAAVQQRVGALVVGVDPMFEVWRAQLAALAAHHAIPTIYQRREFVDAGGLVSYAASFEEVYRRAGVYVGQILKGAKPADLPIVQPTKFELVVNLQAAKALGLTMPLPLLASADEVIE